MPIHVDHQRRLHEIAVATLEVIQRDGIAALTLRAVGAEMGHSTAVVTNYLPTRAALLLNALSYGREIWAQGLVDVVRGQDGPGRLARATRWWCSTDDPIENGLRRLWLEVLITASSDARFSELIADLGYEDRQGVREVLLDSEWADAELIVDAVLLMLRGFWVSTLEDGHTWSQERGVRAIEMLLAGARQSAPCPPGLSGKC